MFYDGDFLDVSPIDVKHHVYLVIVDLHGEKDTKTILDALQAAFPVAHSEVHKGVHTWLGSNNLRIATQAAEALQTGDVAQLGRLMVEAQKGAVVWDANVCCTVPCACEALCLVVLTCVLCLRNGRVRGRCMSIPTESSSAGESSLATVCTWDTVCAWARQLGCPSL